jgi:hypothetical protein
MLMWTIVTAAACLMAIWDAIDHWSGGLDRQAPERWPPVTVLSDHASLQQAYDLSVALAEHGPRIADVVRHGLLKAKAA